LQDNAAGSDAYAGKPAFSCFVENADSGIILKISITAISAFLGGIFENPRKKTPP